MFTLPFKVTPSPVKITISDQMVLMGSCFTGNIGEKLINHKFQVLSNPFGVIYNPISIFKLLKQASNEEIDTENVTKRDEIYYHWDMHSAVSADSRHGLIDLLKAKQSQMKESLLSAQVLVITPGTSFVYHTKEQQKLVANCHKIPQKSFIKSLLTVAEIKQAYQDMITVIRALNPAIKVIFTVSPVRHIKDGLIENNHSKAILIQAIQEIIRDDQQSSYFPAYEMVIDVLRDHRFYKEDMVHPNQQAIDYIWKQFIATYMDHETLKFIDEWENILKAINHRPFNPGSAAHQAFLLKTIDQVEKIKKKADVTNELERLKSGLLKV